LAGNDKAPKQRRSEKKHLTDPSDAFDQQCGGGWFTTQELSIRTQACQRVLARECEAVIKTQPTIQSYTGTFL
jgi:hypothetical protein